MTATTAYRTVFISDTHLGMTGVRSATLLTFLRGLSCETLYLVGDIVDGWALQRHWVWTETDEQVLEAIFAQVEKGTRVV